MPTPWGSSCRSGRLSLTNWGWPGSYQQLRGLRPPAQDEGSVLQKKAADAHADAYLTSVTAQQTYAQNYADALKAAIAKTQQQDQNAQDAVNKTGVQR
jgi:hypothetical protein